ncbi:hypothetical protein AB5J72_29665 [Streptomyces sp. CG1]|uniref:hypothetical protein n=1 Tax=Streptomyces sp. CG1 TaxID=1287523 RepID=UPI0034E1F779
MSWKWEYAFGAEEAARTAPARFLAQVEKKAADQPRRKREEARTTGVVRASS